MTEKAIQQRFWNEAYTLQAAPGRYDLEEILSTCQMDWSDQQKIMMTDGISNIAKLKQLTQLGEERINQFVQDYEEMVRSRSIDESKKDAFEDKYDNKKNNKKKNNVDEYQLNEIKKTLKEFDENYFKFAERCLRTPYLFALANRQHETVEWLLEKGAWTFNRERLNQQFQEKVEQEIKANWKHHPDYYLAQELLALEETTNPEDIKKWKQRFF